MSSSSPYPILSSSLFVVSIHSLLLLLLFSSYLQTLFHISSQSLPILVLSPSTVPPQPRPFLQLGSSLYPRRHVVHIPVYLFSSSASPRSFSSHHQPCSLSPLSPSKHLSSPFILLHSQFISLPSQPSPEPCHLVSIFVSPQPHLFPFHPASVSFFSLVQTSTVSMSSFRTILSSSASVVSIPKIE